MRRAALLIAVTLFVFPLFAETRTPLTRALADALYAALGAPVPATTCTNQFISAIATSGAGTCTTDTLAGALHANQGTTTTLLHGNAAGNPSFGAVVSADLNVTGTTCTNQVLTVLSSSLAGTCTTVTLAGAQFANQGTATTVLHGNASGNPSFGSVGINDVNAATGTGSFAFSIAPTHIDLMTLNSSTQNAGRLLFNGQEFFAASNTDTAGPEFVLGINRTGNRRLMLCDSANLTVNTTNACIRLSINSANTTTIEGVATDNVTNVPLTITGNPLTLNAHTLGGTISGGGNQINNVVIGTTTPLAGAFTTLSATGALTPSQTNGIVGTTTNNNANTGSFGEYITGTTAAATTALTTNTSVNVGANTNISLTAGDWDCYGVVNFTLGATTSVTNLSGGVSTTTGTLPAQDSYFDFEIAANVMTNSKVATYVCPTVRLSISGTTNVFLVTQATFTLSTASAGGTIRCRRMR